MITLNMNEASVAHTGKNAALLSPCHNQSSRLRAVFCGIWAGTFSPFVLRCDDDVLDLFFWRAMFAS
jgi:hypothetical protein